jgi:outer membrane autotransporter protein
MGAWAAYSRTDTKNDFVSTTFASDRDDFLLGFDMRPNDTMLLGVSLGLERTTTDTYFNRGEQDTTSITVAPYVGALLTDWLSVDASIGYSDVSTDQFRTVPGTGARVNSDVESYRLFANGNVAATYSFGNLVASAQAGLLWAKQEDDEFQESNGITVGSNSTHIGRLLLGGELAYTAGAFEPYLNLMFQHDFSKTQQNFAPGVLAPENDDNDLLVALGLRYYGKNGLSASVQYSTLRGRQDLSEHSYSAYVRWAF